MAWPRRDGDPGGSVGGGRERYERADGEAKSFRNGYQRGRMKTAEGTVEFSAPQMRDMPEPFGSELGKI